MPIQLNRKVKVTIDIGAYRYDEATIVDVDGEVIEFIDNYGHRHISVGPYKIKISNALVEQSYKDEDVTF